MKKQKLKEKLSTLKSAPPVKVKKSYYTFSKEYPTGNIPIKRRKNKRVKSRILKFSLYACLFLLICSIAFLTVNTGLDISYKAPDTTQSEEPEEAQKDSLLVSDGVRALYMPAENLGNADYIKEAIKEIRKKNGNSVLVEFKTKEGKLNYSSMQEYALIGKCSVFDNDTVRKAIQLFEGSGITVIARVYCFEDSIVAASSENLAIKYMDTDINWLDGTTEAGGNPWLNPCLKKNHSYITGILSELYNLGVRGFILESCQFPDEKNAAGATYKGEDNYNGRNDALRSFIKKARKALPADAFILLGLSATDAAEGNQDIFHGPITNTSADGIAALLSERKPEYTIDKKTDFASVFSLYAQISSGNKEKAFIPIIDEAEYSRSFISAMNKAGYNNFIIYSEKGEY